MPLRSAKISADTAPTTEELETLKSHAKGVVDKAYAPYSGFRVGAAVLTHEGNFFTGCNVENASYGLSMCAERVAVQNAVVHEGPETRLRAVAIVNAENAVCPPCGACRQVIAELGPNAVVLHFDGKSFVVTRILDLLPYRFHL